jgi:hypothetical protein
MTVLSCGPAKPVAPSLNRDASIAGEIRRLDAELRKLEAAQVSPGLADLRRAARAALTRAARSRPSSLRLYRMRDAEVEIGTLGFLVSHGEGGRNLQSVTALWNETRPLFPAQSVPAAGAALDRALRETAGNRASKLFVASLPYAKASSPGDGLYYLAEADGNRQYRRFLESLADAEPAIAAREQAPRRDALEAAMTALDAETVLAFERDPTGSSAVNPSARLKESHELADQNLLDGAALTLLETRLLLSLAAPPAQQTAPRPEAGSAVPRSIREVFEAAAADSPARAVVIRNDVLPLYASLFVGRTAATGRPRPEVTVTLVRWPYT